MRKTRISRAQTISDKQRDLHSAIHQNFRPAEYNSKYEFITQSTMIHSFHDPRECGAKRFQTTNYFIMLLEENQRMYKKEMQLYVFTNIDYNQCAPI